MHAKISKISLILFLTISAYVLSTPELYAYQQQQRDDLTAKVDELFAEWDKADSPGAAVGIFKAGKILYARGYGMANLEYDIPITTDSVFRVGSVSKQFTAMCIALLAEMGKLSPDDNIRKFLPEMHAFEPPVTIRHLIHHTSGMRDYLVLQGLAGRSQGYFYDSCDVMDLLSRQRGLDFNPGDAYSYSNSGYFLLAEIVHRASGMKTREFAEKFIFEPLGMESTHYHDNPNMIVKNRAAGYMPLEEGGFRIHMTQLDMIGDGGIFTTIDDFFKWDQNFFANRLGKKSAELISMVLTSGKLNDGKDTGYAFALDIDRYRGLKTVGHGGSFVGYKAHYLQFPEQEFSVVILSNLGTFHPGRLAYRIADLYLADILTGDPMPERPDGPRVVPKTISLPIDRLEQYVGEFYSDELDATAVLRLEGQAIVFELGRYAGGLAPISPNLFLGTYMNDDTYEPEYRKIEFVEDGENRVSGFIMETDQIKNLTFKKMR